MNSNFTLFGLLLAGIFNLLPAQSGPLQVNLYTTDTSGIYSPTSSTMILTFANGGIDSVDAQDSELANALLPNEFCVPYTLSAENTTLGPHDNRYFFTAPKVIPFGMYSNHTSNVTFTSESLGSVPNFNSSVWNEEVGNIYLEDLSTGIMHDIFGDTVTLPVPADTIPNAGFFLHLYPALRVTTQNETCNEYADGTMHITNPGSTNWLLLVLGPGGTFSAVVTQTDTLLDMLPSGTYTLLAITNGLLTDRKTITMPPHPAVVPSFTPGTTSEGQGININFTNTSGNTYTWTWNMGDGNYYTSADVAHAYTSAGTYIVNLTAIDSSGCTGDANETITITLQPPAAPPQFQNPNNGPSNHNNNRMASPVLSQRGENTLVITQQEALSVTEIKVFTVSGQLVATQTPASTVTEISLQQGGCYLVMITLADGEITTDKIVLGL